MARSNEVKALGVKMGAPWFQLKELAEKHGIIALSSNYTLYGDMSDRVMSILRDYSPNVEPYSIDESFLSLNGLGSLWSSACAMGQSIRYRVRQWTGLPVCVGIGTSKTLAKFANHIAKKQPQFDGVCDLLSLPRTEVDFLLANIDVVEVWGVGRRRPAVARHADRRWPLPPCNNSRSLELVAGTVPCELKWRKSMRRLRRFVVTISTAASINFFDHFGVVWQMAPGRKQ